MRFSPSLVYVASLASSWLISMIFIRDLAAAFLAALIATTLLSAMVTGKMNIVRFGTSRIVGKESGWYWTFIALLSLCLMAVLVTAAKRDLRSFFSSSKAYKPNKAPEPTLGIARSSQRSEVSNAIAGVAHL